MPKFEIYYEVNGYEDSTVIEGDSLEDIRAYAVLFLERRGAEYTGSKEIKE